MGALILGAGCFDLIKAKEKTLAVIIRSWLQHLQNPPNGKPETEY